MLFGWITKALLFISSALLSVLVYLAIEMRADIKDLTKQMPVVQEQIRMMQDDNTRLKNKVFSLLWQPAKKEDEINIRNLLNLK